MEFPKFPHSAMFVGATACGKTEYLLKLLETKIILNSFCFCVRQYQTIRRTFLGNGFLTIRTSLLCVTSKVN